MRFGMMSFASDGIGAQRSCSDGGSVSYLAVKRSKSVRDSCLLTNAYPFRPTEVLGDSVKLGNFYVVQLLEV